MIKIIYCCGPQNTIQGNVDRETICGRHSLDLICPTLEAALQHWGREHGHDWYVVRVT